MLHFLAFINYIVINAMIVIMLFWMLFWDTEPNNAIRKHWIPLIQKPFIWLGLNSEWRMFAFDPPRRDIWPMVRLTFTDGSVVRWEPASYMTLTPGQKSRFKRMHKYYYTVTGLKSGKQLQRDLIEHVISKASGGKQCSKAELFCVSHDAPTFSAPDVLFEPKSRHVTTFFPYIEAQP